MTSRGLFKANKLSKTDRSIVSANEQVPRDGETFRQVFGRVHLLYSITIPQPVKLQDGTLAYPMREICENLYVSRYSDINLAELYLAFELNLIGELGSKEIISYNEFNPKFMTAILNAFREKRKLSMLELFKNEIIGESLEESSISIEKLEKELLFSIMQDKIAYKICVECQMQHDFVVENVKYKFELCEKLGLIKYTIAEKKDIIQKQEVVIKKRNSRKREKLDSSVRDIEDITLRSEAIYNSRVYCLIEFFKK